MFDLDPRDNDRDDARHDHDLDRLDRDDNHRPDWGDRLDDERDVTRNAATIAIGPAETETGTRGIRATCSCAISICRVDMSARSCGIVTASTNFADPRAAPCRRSGRFGW